MAVDTRLGHFWSLTGNFPGIGAIQARGLRCQWGWQGIGLRADRVWEALWPAGQLLRRPTNEGAKNLTQFAKPNYTGILLVCAGRDRAWDRPDFRCIRRESRDGPPRTVRKMSQSPARGRLLGNVGCELGSTEKEAFR